MTDFDPVLWKRMQAEARFSIDNQDRFTAAFAAVKEATSDEERMTAHISLGSLLQEQKVAGNG